MPLGNSKFLFLLGGGTKLETEDLLFRSWEEIFKDDFVDKFVAYFYLGIAFKMARASKWWVLYDNNIVIEIMLSIDR